MQLNNPLQQPLGSCADCGLDLVHGDSHHAGALLHTRDGGYVYLPHAPRLATRTALDVAPPATAVVKEVRGQFMAMCDCGWHGKWRRWRGIAVYAAQVHCANSTTCTPANPLVQVVA